MGNSLAKVGVPAVRPLKVVSPKRAERARAEPVAEKSSHMPEQGAVLTPFNGLRIGLRIRHARLTLGLRLCDVAESVGCSEGMLSKIEHEAKRPSLNMLHRIAARLQTTVGMLCAEHDEDEATIFRAGKRVVVDMDPLRTGTGIKMERLVPYNKAHLLQGNIHIVEPDGGSDGSISHEGEEVVFVLEGRLEFTVDEKTYLLDTEDSFAFRSELPHSYHNPGPGRARVIFINTPPSF